MHPAQLGAVGRGATTLVEDLTNAAALGGGPGAGGRQTRDPESKPESLTTRDSDGGSRLSQDDSRAES